MTTDASGDSIRAILHQKRKGSEKPISFFSIKLNNAPQKYTTFSTDLLSIYLSIRHFRHLLGRQNITVFPDQKPLTYVLYEKTGKSTVRDTQQLNYISLFISDIRYIESSDNIVADTLSLSTIQSTDSESLTFDFIVDE